MKKNVLGRTSKRRVLAFLLTCVAALALMVPAFAHGGGHHRKTQQHENHIQLCEAEDCHLTGQHVHDGVTYCGNLHEEGYCTGKCEVNPTCTPPHHGSKHQSAHKHRH